ncbi:MAG: CBS domain-containing protein [Anaerolineae bacterium]|nr:CBS domain-containing protein [Anaerolineae bacterium]
MLVRDRMSRYPITVTAAVPIDEALKVMRENKVRRLPVVDRDGRLVGIVSEMDLLYASPSPATSLSVYEIHYLMARITVQDVMTKEVISIEEDTPLEEAARIMVDNKIGGLPVVRDGTLVGIITETDLFKIFLELLGAREKGVRLTLQVPNKKGVLASITSQIAQMGGDIISLGTFLGEDPTEGLLTVKVAEVPQDQLVEALETPETKLVDVRES